MSKERGAESDDSESDGTASLIQDDWLDIQLTDEQALGLLELAGNSDETDSDLADLLVDEQDFVDAIEDLVGEGAPAAVDVSDVSQTPSCISVSQHTVGDASAEHTGDGEAGTSTIHEDANNQEEPSTSKSDDEQIQEPAMKKRKTSGLNVNPENRQTGNINQQQPEPANPPVSLAHSDEDSDNENRSNRNSSRKSEVKRRLLRRPPKRPHK